MMTTAAYCALATTILIVWCLVLPHVQPRTADSDLVDSALVNKSSDQKQKLLQTLRDLEHDFTTGKLNQNDYLELKNRITIELGTMLKHDAR